jgi:type IV pilus assembly protein PilY1
MFGQRDGGRNYWAIQVNPTDANGPGTNPLTTGNVQPKLLWKIQGGVTTGFAKLANTWSTPVRAVVRTPTGPVEALIFGGGHDPSYNSQYGTNTGTEVLGNAVFVVNATTGELIYSIEGKGPTGTATDTTTTTYVDGMNYPIPSKITAFDNSGDGIVDRLYFGDLGGNVWRADLFNEAASPPSSVGPLKANVGLLAELSTDAAGSFTNGKPDASVTTPIPLNPIDTTLLPTLVDKRSIYYPPEVVQINDVRLGGRFDVIIVGTGHRNNPRNTSVQNAVYALFDYKVTGPLDPTTYPKQRPSTDPNATDTSGSPLTRADLVDITGNQFQRSLSETAEQTATRETAFRDAFVGKEGWYLALEQNCDKTSADAGWYGEKVTSAAVVVANKLFFNTFTPPCAAASETAAAQCRVPSGTGRTYGIDLLTGGALFSDWDSDNTDLTGSDRFKTKTGMLSDDIGVGSTPAGLILMPGGGGGTATDGSALGAAADTIDPGTGLPRGRIYWFER